MPGGTIRNVVESVHAVLPLPAGWAVTHHGAIPGPSKGVTWFTYFAAGGSLVEVLANLNISTLVIALGAIGALGINLYEKFRAVRDKSILGRFEALQERYAEVEKDLEAERRRGDVAESRLDHLAEQNNRLFAENLQMREQTLQLAEQVGIQRGFLAATSSGDNLPAFDPAALTPKRPGPEVRP